MARNRIIYQNEGLFIGPATDFITVDEVVYASDFTSSVDGWVADNGTAGYGSPEAGALRFEADGGLVEVSYSLATTAQKFSAISGRTYKITGKAKIKSGAETITKVEIWPFSFSAPIATTTSTTDFESFSATFVAKDDGVRFYAADDDGIFFSASPSIPSNDHFYIKDIVISIEPDMRVDSNLDKVQSIGYSYEISRSDISVLGKGSTVDRPINSSPSVNLQIDYLLSSFSNEYFLGFGMTPANISVRFPMLPDEYLNKSGIANEVERSNDRRNIYLATTDDGLDLQESTTGEIEGVLCFNNCQLTNYTANFEVGGIPSASVGLVGTDSNYYSKAIMEVPLLNKQTGETIRTFSVNIPTGADGLTDFKNRAPEILLPGDISIKIKRNKINIPGGAGDPDIETPKDIFDLQNNKVQTFSVDLPLERSSIDLPGYKINYDKILNFPITSSISMSIIEDGGQTGILSDFINKDLEYNVNVSIRNQSKSVVLAYDFLKVRFNSVSYSHGIGENKVSDVSFSCTLDPIDSEKGMFISGVIY